MHLDDDSPKSGQWRWRLACKRCGAAAGEPCVALADAHGAIKGEPIPTTHFGRESTRGPGRIADLEYIDRCMEEWRRLCARGLSVADIAVTLGMKRSALDQMLCRARRAGHPDAIHHPRAHLKSPTPTPLERSLRRYRKERREARERERAERERHLRRWFVQDSEQDETEE